MRYVLVLILSWISIICNAQNFIMDNNDSTITTEYNDGKLWAYRCMNGYVVGLTCYEVSDDYGKYYQIQLYVNNLNSPNVTFDPNEVSACLVNKKGDTISLEVYTNEEFQKRIERKQNWAMALYGLSVGLNAGSVGYSTSYSTTYSPTGYAYTTMTTHYNPSAAYQANLVANAQIATLGKMVAEERIIKEQGYLKKNTIHPNEGIVGYMNIKREKGHTLAINIPVNGNMYSFEWNINKKMENKR